MSWLRFPWPSRGAVTRLEEKVDKNMSVVQDHIDALAATLAEKAAILRGELTQLKQQIAALGADVDFTRIDAAVADIGDIASPTVEPTPQPEPTPAPDEPAA